MRFEASLNENFQKGCGLLLAGSSVGVLLKLQGWRVLESERTRRSAFYRRKTDVEADQAFSPEEMIQVIPQAPSLEPQLKVLTEQSEIEA